MLERDVEEELLERLLLLVGGAEFLVRGASRLAVRYNLPPVLIGLTIVAFGTSLPELVVSLTAALNGEDSAIAIGNIVGSNIFNLLCVLGLASLVSPNAIPVAANALAFDFPVMIAVAIACLPIFFNGYSINRWEGALFVAYYALYTTYLIFNSSGAPWLGAFQHAMLTFVLPLTAVTLAVIGARAWHRQR